MKITETLTWLDITETPAVLDEFSLRAREKLKYCALKGADKSVHLLGRGSSNNATIFAKYIWETYTGVRADFLRPHSVFEAKCPLRFKGKVLWAFSQSGKSTDVARCLEKIVGWGARAVAVTNEPDMAENPIARAACRHILLSSSRERAVAATKTFALQLWLALWTAQVWSGCFREKDFCETARLIKSLLEDSGRFLRKDAFPFWKDLVKAPVIAFVGRGPLSAVAEDSALKFREMAGVHAAAYSAAEFLHGPIGAHGPKDLVFLLAPSGRLPDDIRKVCAALKERSTVHHIITPHAGKPPFNCLLTDIELKIAALRLALEKGLNPDCPRGLKKVTKTI